MAERRELALGVLGFLDTPAPAFVRIAAEARFDAVSLRVGGSRMPVAADLSAHPEQVDEALAALATTGTRVLDVEVLRLNDAVDFADRAERSLALGRRFGARHLIVVNENLSAAAAASAMRGVCRLAEGIQVCLEFMAFSATPDLAAAVDVVRRSECGNAAVLVDTLHLARTGGRPEEVTDHLDVLAPYAQICGVPRRWPSRGLVHEATRSRRLPGYGTGADRELLRVIPPCWALSVEAPVWGDHRRSAEVRARRSYEAIAS